MDVTTHFLIPFAGAFLGLAFARSGNRDRAGLALLIGLSGFAPDVDGLLDPIAERVDDLYWLQHRGVSHTLVGAPLFALAIAGAAGLLARWRPEKLGILRWRTRWVPWIVLGSWTHLVLDGVTYAGVPLLWPFAFGRYGFMLFHWIVIWLFPAGVIAIGLYAWGKLSDRGLARAGAIFVAALVLLAGLRVATYPEDLPEGARVFPRSSELEWTVLVPHANGTWEGFVQRGAARTMVEYYAPSLPAGSEGAIARARETSTYRGFLMGSFGPEVVRALPLDEGAWNVTFTDVAQRYEATHGARWTPTEPFEAWGYVAFTVRAGGAIEVTHRGW